MGFGQADFPSRPTFSNAPCVTEHSFLLIARACFCHRSGLGGACIVRLEYRSERSKKLICAIVKPQANNRPRHHTAAARSGQFFEVTSRPNWSGVATGKLAVRSKSPSSNTSTASTTRAGNTPPSDGNHPWLSNKALRANKSETFDSLKFTLEGSGERSDGNARTSAHAPACRA